VVIGTKEEKEHIIAEPSGPQQRGGVTERKIGRDVVEKIDTETNVKRKGSVNLADLGNA
jgi:hypothetical protein